MLKEPVSYYTIGIILPLIWLSCCYGGGEVDAERSVGGPCEYKLYPGRARIISISEVIEPGSLSKKRYEVKFSFSADRKVDESFAQTEGKEFFMLLGDNSYPGQAFLKKYAIEVDSIFVCIMKVIAGGTCTPILFEFPTMNLRDTLEE